MKKEESSLQLIINCMQHIKSQVDSSYLFHGQHVFQLQSNLKMETILSNQLWNVTVMA